MSSTGEGVHQLNEARLEIDAILCFSSRSPAMVDMLILDSDVN
jgi:hypothetical protein